VFQVSARTLLSALREGRFPGSWECIIASKQFAIMEMMRMTVQTNDEHPDPLGLERLVFFSDAVIAIAITLLVLELKVPEIEPGSAGSELARQVAALGPKYLGYLTSFWVIAFYWMSHHRTFRYIRDYDAGLLRINMLVLFFIAFVPFPTALLFQYPAQWITVVLYAGTLAAIGLSMLWLWRYATQNHRLVEPSMSPLLIRSLFNRLLVTPAVFLISILVAFFNPGLAMDCWLVLLILFFVIRTNQPQPGATSK
jgi:uncharacterized membrane protein